MITKFKKDKYLWGLAIIVLLVFVVRVWAFSDLLTFKMDQSRDIKLVEDAYDRGVGELPLLGPRAAKTYLRLGPAAYYFEYVSLLIFGDNPWAMAIPDFIFSILTIPLFYYFLRQAFSKRVSLMTIAVFASSFFLTQYGRFAWNPNAIPFWSLLYFLGLYKIVYSAQFKVHGSGKWLLVTVIGYGVASQLHFTAMLAYPLVGGIFIFGSFGIKQIIRYKLRTNSKIQGTRYKQISNSKLQNINKFRVKDLMLGISWKYWFGSFAILGIMYLPMVFSEICTQGDNWLQFKYALSGRGKEEFTLYAKIIQSLKLHSEYFWFSLTSISGGAGTWGVLGFVGIGGAIFWKYIYINFKFKILSVNSSLNGLMFNFKNKKSEADVKKQLASRLKVNKNLESSTQKSKYLFFLLIWTWFGVMFLLYTKLAFNVIKPRYWLLEAPIFFVWLALIFEWLAQRKNIVKKGGYFLVGILVMINLYAVGNWYWILQHQEDNKLPLWELKLKDKNMIPWGQLQKSADYVEDLSNQTNKDICFYATGEYRPVYDYIFEHRGVGEKIRRISFKNDNNENCLFVTIDHHRHRDLPRIPKDHQDEFEKVIEGKKEVGFVTIWQVIRREQYAGFEIKGGVKFNEKEEKVSMSEDEKLVTGVLVVDNGMEEGSVSAEIVPQVVLIDQNKPGKVDSLGLDEKKPKKPKRVERVRWKDVFNCE